MSDTIYQVLVILAQREQPCMLGFRKWDDALRVAERFADKSDARPGAVHDDFGQTLVLPNPPVASMAIDPERASEMTALLSLLNARAQAAFNSRAQADPKLRASNAIAMPPQMLHRG